MCNWSREPDSKVHGANVGPTWDREDPGGPHVGTMSLVNGVAIVKLQTVMCTKLLTSSLEQL